MLIFCQHFKSIGNQFIFRFYTHELLTGNTGLNEHFEQYQKTKKPVKIEFAGF